MTIKYKLAQSISIAIGEAQKEGVLTNIPIPEIIIEKPQNSKFGDYASSLPLKIARSAGMKPFEVANKIKEFLPDLVEVEKIVISSSGFINFMLKRSWLIDQINSILSYKENWGNLDIGHGKLIQIEFVSVNPTGPLHVGHGRGAILGNVLSKILTCAGYKVEKEYYVNDAGNQLNAFYRSLYVRYQQIFNKNIDMPENGYMGNYVLEIASSIYKEYGNKFENLSDAELLSTLGNLGINMIMKSIKDDLELLGVNFDVWFSEKSLNETGIYVKVMNLLETSNFTTEREKAIWFVSSILGEDKDNVLVRSDGTPTYFAYDIAYHFDKFINRNFASVIDIWGADHQGHVSRMKAALNALGINPERLEIIITQLVTVRRGEEIVRISKRSGDLIALREVIDEVGADACKYAFLCRSADSQMDFDLELAKKQSDENPIYYIQYAHARICSILRLAEESNIDILDGDVSLLNTEPEYELIKYMIMFSDIIEISAVNREPHHLAFYAYQLATVFHSFYKQCRVITDNRDLSKARLKLVKATQVVLAKTLNLMSINAPESM